MLYLLFIVNPCDPNPCDNGGTCQLVGDGSTRCLCPLGYSDDYCDTSN